MKTLIKVIIVLIVLGIAGIIALFAFALTQVDALAKTAIEQGGTYAMQVDTTVQTVDVSLTAGTATMQGLNIANPAGFSTDHFFQLADSSASLDLGSVSSDRIVMPEIRLKGIDVILDKGQNPSNYNKILENLKRFESGDAGPSEPKKGEGPGLVINSLVLEDINIRVANMPGVSLAVGDVAVNIPEITLKNVGEKESMSPGEVINLVIKTVLAAAVEAGGGIIPADVLGELGNGLSGLTSLGELGIDAISDLDLEGAIGDVTEEINKAAQDVQKQVDDASKQIGDQIDQAADDLKGIFGGKKDDP